MKHRNELVHQKVNKKFTPKVCCCCNRFIMHSNERLLPTSYLKHQNVQNFLKMDADDWASFEVEEKRFKISLMLNTLKNVLIREKTED